MSYQWFMNGVEIPGATDSEYSLFNVQLTDAGTYSVLFSTAEGGTSSSNALLSVGIAPVITQQPTNLAVVQGATAVFNAAASGLPLSYYWLSGTTLAGTNASLTITNVQPGQAGSYVFVSANFLGSVTSAPAALSVLYPITLVSGPTNQMVWPGGPAVFSVTATGFPLDYQWYYNGSAIAGATASDYFIGSVTLTNAGGWFAVVSNQFNSVTSNVANLLVGSPPQTMQLMVNAAGLPES